jgi:fused signal recognition particle receptor
VEPVLLVIVIAALLVALVAGLVVGGRRRSGDTDRSPAGTDVLDRPTIRPDEDTVPTGTVEAPAEPEVVEVPAEPGVVEAPAEPEAVEAPPISLAERFRLRLARTRNVLGASVVDLFGRGVTDEAWEGLEEALISADVGVAATTDIVEQLRRRAKEEGVTSAEGVVALLKQELRTALAVDDRSLRRATDHEPTVWMMTGVNGTGKTTTIGKLAAIEEREGRSVVLAAADTFRAAAAEQLGLWAQRTGARLIRKDEGADPASVAYDAYMAAKATDADLLIIDTAGRLHNKRELMDELGKVKRVVEKQSGPIEETLLVLDATTGQNGIQQARAFLEAVAIDGLVLTKLDGSSKGGIAIAVQRELGLPVKLVGLGEDVDDLAPFDPDAFVEGLFTNFEAAT